MSLKTPVLSYASYCLDNWYKIDANEEISLENVALINNFLGGVDEDWFVTIHVAIENQASGAIEACMEMMEFNSETPESEIKKQLKNILQSMIGVNNIFLECQKNVTICLLPPRKALYFRI